MPESHPAPLSCVGLTIAPLAWGALGIRAPEPAPALTLGPCRAQDVEAVDPEYYKKI